MDVAKWPEVVVFQMVGGEPELMRSNRVEVVKCMSSILQLKARGPWECAQAGTGSFHRASKATAKAVSVRAPCSTGL